MQENILDGDEIKRKNTVSELCKVWTDSKSDIEKAFALIDAAQSRLDEFFGATTRDFRLDGYHFHVNYSKPEESVKELQRQVWQAVMEKLELRKIMSLKRIKEMDDQLSTGKDLPDLNEANVMSILHSNMSKSSEYLQEKVHECYEWLRPRHNPWSKNYVTNEKSLAAGVGKKIILKYMVKRTVRNGRPCWEVNYNSQDVIRAVDQVFHLLDAKPSIDDSWSGELSNAITGQTEMNGGATAETDYFRVKCYGNENLHLEFKRDDLLQKFNLIAGGNRLQA